MKCIIRTTREIFGYKKIRELDKDELYHTFHYYYILLLVERVINSSYNTVIR